MNCERGTSERLPDVDLPYRNNFSSENTSLRRGEGKTHAAKRADSGDQIEEAEQKKDMNKIDELNKKMDELATKLGPEYAALMSGLQDIDPNSKESLEIGSGLEALDKLCAK